MYSGTVVIETRCTLSGVQPYASNLSIGPALIQSLIS